MKEDSHEYECYIQNLELTNAGLIDFQKLLRRLPKLNVLLLNQVVITNSRNLPKLNIEVLEITNSIYLM